MNEKRVSYDEIHEAYCEFIDSCGKFSFYTRSIETQRQKVAECDNYLVAIKQYKSQAIEKNNEPVANQFFHMQCMIHALRSSLLMWIELKECSFENAWTHLVDAQEYTAIALRLNDYEGVRNLEARLKGAEQSLFPGWKIYNSPGFVETVGKCSVCHAPFSECDHVENEIYMGSLCQRIDRNIVRVDHFAFVENPRDRRCIITKTSDDDGNEIDYFTWEKTGKKVNNEEGHHVEGRMFCIPTLDVL
ncbi:MULTISPECIES: hypothetical protein [Gammaproteobacteria]|uniref:Uncharacterized protein n=1 Tax=Oceanimonas baumannii TaxID=129578 RepID=A0A235CHC0_9GAMM|nr:MULTISPECIES: hypothetical protein [Gammaproteobacteria]OYD23913.1 hypothetical protein B6S09_10680 [Oceanimonas baumannii]TDW58755.1 hypothetical protein LY04_02107 [Oceanimonas baumannii]HCD14118.1 hypothetical protein [Shewanella sp.]